MDHSNGYESIANAFTRARTPSIGPATVRKWAKRLPPGATVLDLGCGFGVPISEVLLQENFHVHGVDASPTLVARFQDRFPNVPIECSPVEHAAFFNRTFDAAVAWGLMFLLPADAQRALIAKVARTLNRPGHFLFTSPMQECSWLDAMTGFPSISLGHDAYVNELVVHGLVLEGNEEDEGGNYYYFSAKP
jgi:cyclopropane fatty-acyl-phospholipid synthase-like methyltransferase